MVQIVVNRIIPDPEPLECREEWTFDFGDGNWRLRFDSPFEWRMGTEGWEAKLFCTSKDVSTDHHILKSLNTGKGFHLPRKYTPWCCSKPILVLHPWGTTIHPYVRPYAWDTTVHLYDVDNRRATKRSLAGFPSEIQWAPLGELLAITIGDGHVQVLDENTEAVVSISIRHPTVFWWRDGMRILVVNRESRSANTRLSLFDSNDGRLLGSTDFDPSELLPYDSATYSSINRDTFSLETGPGRRRSGTLLDTWSRLEFDNNRCILRGTVYRPDGPCEERDGEHMCVAKERSVEVTVSA